MFVTKPVDSIINENKKAAPFFEAASILFDGIILMIKTQDPM